MKKQAIFSVGERVKVRPDLGREDYLLYNYHGLNEEMIALAGHIVTIEECDCNKKSVQGRSDGCDYYICEDNCAWTWTADCFIRIEPEIDPTALLEFL